MTTSIPRIYQIIFKDVDPLLSLFGGTVFVGLTPRTFIKSILPMFESSSSPTGGGSSSSSSSSKNTSADSKSGTTSTADSPSSDLTPLNALLCHQAAALYLYIALNSALILRLTDKIKIWQAMQFACGMTDSALLAAAWYAMGKRFFDPRKWRKEDWFNLSVLTAGVAFRFSFVAGVGMDGADHLFRGFLME